MARNRKTDAASVPSGRLARLGRFGRLAAGAAGRAAADGLGAALRGEPIDPSSLLLTPANARRLADELAHLRGAAMKMGQMLSMDAGDVLPPEFAELLSRLREAARPMPPHQLKRVLTRNWGPDWLQRFERFEARPMAAASIGQVHRARTRDGRDLAIKIQYPGVRDSIDSDVDNLASLIGLAGVLPKGLDLAPLLAEAKRQLSDEADYQREGRMLSRFEVLLADEPDFVIPTLAEDFTTSDILAMGFLPGEPIESAVDALPSERKRIVTALIRLTARELFEFGLIQSDPNFANFRYQADTGRIGLLDFGAVQAVPAAIADGYRALLGAALNNDADQMAAALHGLGYLSDATPSDQRALVLELTALALSPLASDAPFAFDAGALIEPLREGGLRLRAMGYAELPDPQAVFIQRKIGGLYLLGARLGAQVTLRPLLAPFVAAPKENR